MIPDFLKRTWCEINLDHLQYNIQQIKKKVSHQLIAVVKADAYGHGDCHFCKALDRLGVSWFAVSNFAEACVLRQEGFTQQILILGYTPVQYASRLSALHLTQTVYELDYARQLNESAATYKMAIQVHIKIDTGMNRLGLLHQQLHNATDEIQTIWNFKYLKSTGIFTHFAHADSHDAEAMAYSNQQRQWFEQLIEHLEQRKMIFEWRHIQNSAGMITQSCHICNAVRVGIALYGILPSEQLAPSLSVKPVMSMKSVVSMVKQVGKGAQISYDRTFTAPSPLRLATISVGYADGYDRRLSSIGEMLIHGQRCPVVGRVCMDQTVVDVSKIDPVQSGDIVTIFGRDGKQMVTADELAGKISTIPYEILCGISRRVPRIYLQQKQIIGVTDYLSPIKPI